MLIRVGWMQCFVSGPAMAGCSLFGPRLISSWPPAAIITGLPIKSASGRISKPFSGIPFRIRSTSPAHWESREGSAKLSCKSKMSFARTRFRILSDRFRIRRFPPSQARQLKLTTNMPSVCMTRRNGGDVMPMGGR